MATSPTTATSYRETESHHAAGATPIASTPQGCRRLANQRSEENDYGVELQDLPLGATALVSRMVSVDSGRSSPRFFTGATSEEDEEEEEGVLRSRNGAETDERAESRLSSRRHSLSSSLGTGVARRLRRGKALHDFWGEHVSMLVEQDSCRDHLGKCCALSHPPPPSSFGPFRTPASSLAKGFHQCFRPPYSTRSLSNIPKTDQRGNSPGEDISRLLPDLDPARHGRRFYHAAVRHPGGAAAVRRSTQFQHHHHHWVRLDRLPPPRSRAFSSDSLLRAGARHRCVRDMSLYTVPEGSRARRSARWVGV